MADKSPILIALEKNTKALEELRKDLKEVIKTINENTGKVARSNQSTQT